MKSFLNQLFYMLVCVYRYGIRPVCTLLGIHTMCRFYPTCSEYILTSIHRYGWLKGSYKGLKRLVHCHPFSK